MVKAIIGMMKTIREVRTVSAYSNQIFKNNITGPVIQGHT